MLEKRLSTRFPKFWKCFKCKKMPSDSLETVQNYINQPEKVWIPDEGEHKCRTNPVDWHSKCKVGEICIHFTAARGIVQASISEIIEKYK